MFAALAVVAGTASSCGDSFLKTEYYKGVDVKDGLNSVKNIATALNGTYYQFFHYNFTGNYALTIGDVPTDISYWNGKTGHWDGIYTFTFADTDGYLQSIWEYGYKTADNAARVIKASLAMYDSCNDDEKAELDRCLAEAYALRGYAQLMLVNVFGHQVKVNGTDFSSQPGIVVIDQPKEALARVERSSIGDSYSAILTDFGNAMMHFEKAGGDRGDLKYFGKASVKALMARTYLYMERWDEAAVAAQDALKLNESAAALAYDAASYKALYKNPFANTESFMGIAITSSQNWSANSRGNLWTTYNYSPSPKLLAMYAENDCRKSIFGPGKDSTPEVPVFNGGKVACEGTGNAALATNYIVGAPEMYLIIAEANLMSANGNKDAAASALLTVAKRNPAIASAADLPQDKDGMMKFIKDERARELFQEGLRLYDLRRWDEKADVWALGAPEVKFTYSGYKISDLVFPIPSAEVNAGFGVKQNEGWSKTLPTR